MGLISNMLESQPSDSESGISLNENDGKEARTLMSNVTMIPKRNLLALGEYLIGALVVFVIMIDMNKPVSHHIANQGYVTEKSEVIVGNHHSDLAQLQEMIDSTEEVIITMPAKAAGSSLKQFAAQCHGKDWLQDNYLNLIDKMGMKWLTGSFELPKVMASHMYNEKNFVHLIKNVPNRALMIYSHRDETDRLLSAINEAITNWCRGNNGYGPTVAPPDFFSKRDDKNCFILEKTLIERAIKQGVYEIGIGSTRLLTCTLYETLETNAPNFFFMDSRKASELMSLVAAKYCPTLVDETVVENIADEKEYGAFVQMKTDTGVAEEIPLREWLNVKRGHLELLLGLNNGASCRAKTRVMEKMLFSSGEGFVSADDVIAQFH